MGDCDDVPQLVDSSDEECNGPTPSEVLVNKWATKPGDCEPLIKPYVLAPFLFGFDSDLPKHWIAALHDCGLLATKNRSKDVTVLSKEEWGLVDFVDDVYELVADILTSRSKLLPDILDFIDKIDAMLLNVKMLNVKKTVELAQEDDVLRDIGKDVMSSKTCFRKSESRTLFCLIYIFKNCKLVALSGCLLIFPVVLQG
ncbi:uncharacterized protein LOC121386179 [Gigantopelta aegis]|uniref:uncharacterized protein LOC121386179 n=1 Tax=Gigantopelta aegis TaxID=1735272 RepID=UPI001B88C37D|nr:uncharacterized protein LOC121386179 [Gigantopelta aegis]